MARTKQTARKSTSNWTNSNIKKVDRVSARMHCSPSRLRRGPKVHIIDSADWTNKVMKKKKVRTTVMKKKRVRTTNKVMEKKKVQRTRMKKAMKKKKAQYGILKGYVKHGGVIPYYKWENGINPLFQKKDGQTYVRSLIFSMRHGMKKFNKVMMVRRVRMSYERAGSLQMHMADKRKLQGAYLCIVILFLVCFYYNS